jgi:adenylate cyclase
LRYAFEGYVLDTDRRELLNAKSVISVQPQVFDLLEHLIRNRDRVVSKDDMLAAIWGGRIVSDSTLASRINAARRAIGDSGKEQRLIRTLPRKGIRFVGTLRVWRKAVENPPEAPAAGDAPSIAVLPFNNMSNDPDQQYFADGITEDIITALSKWRWFFVIARNSSFTYKNRTIDVRQVGWELGVRYVLEGSVRRIGNRLRLNAQLIDTVSGTHIWAEHFDRNFVDIFNIQEELISQVAAAIGPVVSRTETQQAKRKRSDQLAAWDHYLRGMWHFHQFTGDDSTKAIASLNRAIELDESFALAHAGIARTLLSETMYRGSERKTSVASVIEAAKRALSIDSENVDAYYALSIASAHNNDTETAFEFALRATQLNGNFAPGHFALAIACLYLGRPVDGLNAIDRALRLSPMDPQRFTWLATRASALYLLKRYLEAIGSAKQSLALNRYQTALRVLAAACAQLGMMQAARDAINELMASGHGDKTIADVIRPFKRATDRESYREGLGKAGMPES